MALYDTFLKGVVNKEFTAYKKDEFLKMVKSLDDEGIKTFLLIIKLHELKSSPTSDVLLPYEGVSDDVEITFDLEKFPSLLQNILYKFMEMHTKHKQIEKERELFDKPI